jgi:hypothetical protein
MRFEASSQEVLWETLFFVERDKAATCFSFLFLEK